MFSLANAADKLLTKYLFFLQKTECLHNNTNGLQCRFPCVFKSISHTFDLFLSGIVKPFFSSGLSSSLSTYTHGSIYNLYAMEFFFSVRVRPFNFLRFPSHWASKEHCVALSFNLSFSVERFLHRFVKKDFATDQRSWRLILHYRQQIDNWLQIWLCGNRTVSIDEDMTNSLRYTKM